MPPRTLLSPLYDETVLRLNQAGRADQIDTARLRGDFKTALEALVQPGERVLRVIAIRPDRIGSRDVPASVLVLTSTALLHLREPTETEGGRYGMRSMVVPLRAIAGVGLGEQLLRGSFAVMTTGQGHLDIPYHVLDDNIFQQLLRDIRSVASL